jgi:hypothetical protein
MSQNYDQLPPDMRFEAEQQDFYRQTQQSYQYAEQQAELRRQQENQLPEWQANEDQARDSSSAPRFDLATVLILILLGMCIIGTIAMLLGQGDF